MKEMMKVPHLPARKSAPVAQLFLFLLVVATLTATTHTRNDVWQNDIVLWEDAAAKNPDSGRIHHNLGKAYDAMGLSLEAFNQYTIAASLDPDTAIVHETLGMAYVSMGQLISAQRELETALRLAPDLPGARAFLVYIATQNKQSTH